MLRVSYDMWASERERAELLPNGLRILREMRQDGKAIARAWKPKAIKPMFAHAFRSIEEREAYIARTIKAHDEQQAYKAARRAELATGNLSLADPGAIFYYSWGYDQTNVDYFQVVARRGHLATLRKIQCESVGGAEGFSSMSDYVRPIKDAFFPPPCETCGKSEGAVWHESTCGSYEHRFVAAPPPVLKKRLQFHGGKPCIRFDNGLWSLVEILESPDGEKAVYKSHYRSWYA